MGLKRSTNSQGSWAQIFVSSASVVVGEVIVGVVGCVVGEVVDVANGGGVVGVSHLRMPTVGKPRRASGARAGRLG